EARLSEHPAVRSCAVLAREDQPGDRQLVAYVVPRDGDRIPNHQTELGRHLERTLPEHMVPSAFVTLDELPLTTNGKLDRKALPAPGIESYARREYVAPGTPTERLLADAWARVLGFDAERISADDNFFALGGHSLLITVLAARLREQGIDVPVREVFRAPTLAHLAEEIDRAEHRPGYTVPPNRIPDGCDRITPEMLPLVDLTAAETESVVARVPGGAPNVQDVYPLVPAQQGILVHHLMDPENDPYVIPILLTAPDEETCARFVTALQALVDRHDVMRTVVLTEDLGEPVQVVLRQVRLDVERTRLSADADAEEQARAFLDDPGVIALDRAPLMRLRIAEDPRSPRRFLLLSVHHLIEDATSLRLILEELASHMAGESDSLAPSVPFRDFVGHTLHQLASNDAEAFFRNELGDLTEPTTPFQLSDVHGDGSRILSSRRSLPQDLDEALRAQARRVGASPASLFHAAWALVAAAATGRDDVVFGTVLSGRLQGVAGVERMLGNFINTLPLRVRLGDRSVRDLVSEVDASLKELIVHEQSSLVLAQRCSGLGGDAALFSSGFNFRRYDPGEGERGLTGLDEWGVRWLGAVDRTNYPLGVSVDDLGDELSMNAQVEDSVSPDAVLDYVQAAVEGIVGALAEDDGEGTRAFDIDVVPPAEHRLLAEWNDTARPYPHDSCLFELFEEQVARRPGAVAVEYGDLRLTYAETDARANRIAHYLRHRGVGPDTLVGLYTERSPETVVGLLGILKAGGAYVPIDPAYPEERVRALVEGSGVSLVLSQSHLPTSLLGDAVTVLHLDTGELAADRSQVLEGQPEHGPSREELGLTPEHLAYVIFTSGSTGRPKGVQVPQRGVVRLVRNPDYFTSDEHTVMLHHSSISFDVGSQEILCPLTCGGRLVLHDGDAKDVERLLDTVERAGVNTMGLSAAFLPAFAEASERRRLPLEYLGVGGEAFSARDVRRLHRAQPGLTVVNAYGPTENSIASTCHVIPRDVEEDAVIPIGAPIAQSTAYVTDRDLRPVPRGVVGELCVGGAGVARGYLNDPERTKERFVPDPFADAPEARLYRTGDLARWLPDGTLEFVGRVDDQVKIRGFRVEPGEIESALLSHPSVSGVAVTPQSLGETRKLVAHVCPADEYLEDAAREQNGERLDQWRRLFEDQYSEADGDGGGDDLNLVGWNSSYTGEPIPESEMREWIDDTVARIAELRPRRLLEVGCGTGLLLYRYAELCESVHAVDISASALAGVKRGVDQRGWSHVTLGQADALSLPESVEEGYDTVVINSVAQYFPNRRYLDEAIAGLLPLLKEGGRILVGDVRNLDLFPAHLCAVERGRGAGRIPVGELAARVQRRRQQETELLVSPTYFARVSERFPDLDAVDIVLKRGTGENEMLGYRYDVVLVKGGRGGGETSDPLPWLEAATVEEARSLLRECGHRAFGVTGLSNPRVEDDVRISEGLTHWPAARPVEPLQRSSRLPASARERVEELESLLRYAEGLGFRAAATWSQDRPDGLDLVFGKEERPRVRARGAYRQPRLANVPQIARVGQAMARLLKDHLAGRVPEYMVPSVFVALETLPLTPNGKVDKRALPAPDEGDVHKETYVEPTTGTERTLCRLVQEVLGLERVGLRDGFFDLGGHSLLATRLTIRVKQETGAELPLRLVLAGATVGEMAAALEDGGTEGATVPLVPLADDGAAVPLSLQQGELWFLNRPEHLASSYDNVQTAYRIIGRLDRDAYAAACERLVERHEILRTSYLRHGDAHVQRVNGAAGFAVSFEEVSGEAAVAELLRVERARPFAPDESHMIRVRVLVLSELEHVAVVTRPWGVLDGWSTGVLLSDLNILYRELSQGGEPSLPPLPVRYADFAHWQHQAVGRAELDRQEAYWRQRLSGLPSRPSLRTDYRRCPVRTYRGASVGLEIPRELLVQLRRFSDEHGVTLYMTLLSAFAVLLSSHSEDRELAIGTPVTNRPHPDLERVVGYFVNVLVMRLDVTAEQDFSELLSRTRSVTAEAHENRDLPFARLVEALVPDPDPAYPPLVQAMFNLVPTAEAEPSGEDSPELGFLPEPSEEGVAKFDLNLVVRETPSGLQGHMEYSTDLFDRRTVEHMVSLYEGLLLKAVVNPGADLSELLAAARDRS
ncbi:non-ribosomal peptide synthetase, partial [Nocardiopsis halotolerans]|uniref:non-ribosomal peptide synthetase n=1 Tax=Nocardiopsis halotolerans TaxID=124252 RepID=UPI0003794FBF